MINEAQKSASIIFISSDILISVPLLLHEVTNELRNLIRSSIEREMTGIEDVDFGLRHVRAIASPAPKIERQIVLPQMTSRRGCFSRIHACHLG